jgi:hypothetical protein
MMEEEGTEEAVEEKKATEGRPGAARAKLSPAASTGAGLSLALS